VAPQRVSLKSGKPARLRPPTPGARPWAGPGLGLWTFLGKDSSLWSPDLVRRRHAACSGLVPLGARSWESPLPDQAG
jgi:hypothetical protein